MPTTSRKGPEFAAAVQRGLEAKYGEAGISASEARDEFYSYMRHSGQLDTYPVRVDGETIGQAGDEATFEVLVDLAAERGRDGIEFTVDVQAAGLFDHFAWFAGLDGWYHRRACLTRLGPEIVMYAPCDRAGRRYPEGINWDGYQLSRSTRRAEERCWLRVDGALDFDPVWESPRDRPAPPKPGPGELLWDVQMPIRGVRRIEGGETEYDDSRVAPAYGVTSEEWVRALLG